MKKYISFIMVFLGCLTACEDSFLDIKDPNRLTEETYFKNLEQTGQSVNAIYSSLYFGGLFVREYYFVFDLLGNEAMPSPAGNQSDIINMGNYSFDENSNDFRKYWHSLYRTIYRSNFAIQVVNALEVNAAQQQRRDRQLGQAHFFRAWAYFELVTSFGKVPLRLSVEDHQLDNFPRAEVPNIWKQIKTDLQIAVDALPNPGVWPAGELGRVTKGSALALLGKSHLYLEEYDLAIQAFGQVGPLYSLVNSFEDNFTNVNENNSESIFEVQFAIQTDGWMWYMFNGQNGEGVREQPVSGGATHASRAKEYGIGWDNVVVPEPAVKRFQYLDEDGNAYTDPRAYYTFYGGNGLGDGIRCDQCATTINYATSDFPNFGYRYKKYSQYEYMTEPEGPLSEINHRLIRFADVLLMHAEAIIRSNGSISEAFVLINQVRARTGAFEYSAEFISTVNQQKAFELLRLERALELTGEEHRWRDLIRWGIAQDVINAEKGKAVFLPKHKLFPIPFMERQINQTLDQQVQDNWN